ncbi:DUF2794 domain-containing protein [Pseudohoeflea coraliihabitans]|uniref:DUF2794 domain-containing protein n=1 Tax=Pseudohoeflea coraliihabitans TaxID=2860393 RepID=A0ABS6WNQ2_9HYPH|nr:DUF2794 domain-containing protein [Pseudohoeflea sp. DP4N28-3]MBW3096735.1 DUF2794 domain-containing protein [Pseudohoeflea sp. DP4N28-3]
MVDNSDTLSFRRSAAEEVSTKLVHLDQHRRAREAERITFHRRELDLILRLYGRMVAEGEWRDYAIDHLRERAVFSVFRRASEVALFQIVKDPALARKQGAFMIVAASGAILKRGHELAQVLKFFDKPPRAL